MHTERGHTERGPSEKTVRADSQRGRSERGPSERTLRENTQREPSEQTLIADPQREPSERTLREDTQPSGHAACSSQSPPSMHKHTWYLAGNPTHGIRMGNLFTGKDAHVTKTDGFLWRITRMHYCFLLSTVISKCFLYGTMLYCNAGRRQ